MPVLFRFNCDAKQSLKSLNLSIAGCGWFSGVRGPNFTKLGEDIGDHRNIAAFYQSLDVLLHFQTPKERKKESSWVNQRPRWH